MNEEERIDLPKSAHEKSLADELSVNSIEPSIEVLILQHPQEAKEVYGTGRLAARVLSNSRLRIGLSWRSLKQALKEERDPKKWAVLYVGGQKLSMNRKQPITYFDVKNNELQEAPELEGVIVLDCSWPQAKTFWWKNAWLRKLIRIGLNPGKRSEYSIMRREPRKECLSTIESIAFLLKHHNGDESSSGELEYSFHKLIEKYKKSSNAS